MKPRADFDEDFGFSGLTKYLQFRSAPRDAAGLLSFVEMILEEKGRAYALEVIEDALRLTRSPLSDEMLSTIWLVTTEARFDPMSAGVNIRTWLEQITDTCASFIRLTDSSFEPADPAPASHPELLEDVLAELRGIGPVMADKAATSIYVPPLPLLVSTLKTAVTTFGPDLGFRLLLRAMKVYFVPIGPSRLKRLEEIGSQLGYHKWVVEDGSLNIWSDLSD
ncbi:hypothetical protein [Kitasatospora sp. NPDC093806]|uniref:hypothetical protein n=1 Tax=Kitasatospora sp. NPDC093806 TaxID=3155075 RepID=UPI003423D117